VFLVLDTPKSQIDLFMQNKPNLKNTQMNLNILSKRAYENFIPLAGQKNKPNSNPNKPNFQNAKNERKLICYRGL